MKIVRAARSLDALPASARIMFRGNTRHFRYTKQHNGSWLEDALIVGVPDVRGAADLAAAIERVAGRRGAIVL